jgi:ADP-dependent NAD(P)H-hydrate dehydratase / NAD(P)H-hydrate epimerase
MKSIKVVTATEMARVEERAVQAGCDREGFVRQAGVRVAEVADHFGTKNGLLLIGKGNKGADAFAAGIALLEAGWEISAYCIGETQSSLCMKFADQFRKAGGKFQQNIGTEGLLIDGLLGTGFRGRVEGVCARMIEEANRSKIPILAIDLPSGLDGTTGESGGSTIDATITVAMGMPKIGCFLRDGWNHVGQLIVVDFGLPQRWIEEAEAVAFLPERESLRAELPLVKRTRHKYERGCVVGYAGSKKYSGAAQLASLAALRGGAGIVKLMFPAEAEREMDNVACEVVKSVWTEQEWQKADSDAFFIGPGLGSDAEVWVRAHVPRIKGPSVLDAGPFLRGITFPAHAICTPHRGEMMQLLQEELEEMPLLERCQTFCDERKIILILKGAPTWIFVPRKKPWLIAHGDPGMATAGSGDVLTGLLAALLAQKCQPETAAVLGAMLHALAGEAAAEKTTSYCMIARDLIDCVPEAFRRL